MLHRIGEGEDEMGRSITALVVLIGMLAGLNVGASAQEPSWPEVKCARYKKAWSDALARTGRKGLGQEFLDRHEAFLSSGCTTKADVCPRSSEELALANMMVVAAMNAGTASTFPPFACRKER
ncbi:hypothetical protein AA309_04540 [Microvirga vignae]|uniref:Uncharacterized protein n=1 Tax=Microvirga vignae TaxID=1225564 RepID=A0A0H1RGK0_9HYPH|nr:hypothetical protein [Microvirga vignae]KLK94229.1 hypothetical protein AA309_04540 [Microvirga vignae]